MHVVLAREGKERKERTNDNRTGEERKIGGKWKFREARRWKNAVWYCSIDMLLRRLLCLLESSRRTNALVNNQLGEILLGVEETRREVYSITLSRLLESHDFR